MKPKFFTKGGFQKVPNTSYPPVGSIVAFAGSSAPNGWLLCQGQQLLRTDYAALSSLLAETYGSYTNGSGSTGTTHFRLPDLRGRIGIGSGSGVGAGSSGMGAPSGSSLTSRTLGATGGQESITLTAAQSGVSDHAHAITGNASTSHSHTKTDSHAHKFPIYSNPYRVEAGYEVGIQSKSGSSETDANTSNAISSTTASFTVATAPAGVSIDNSSPARAASAHSTLQPVVVMNYIICAVPQ